MNAKTLSKMQNILEQRRRTTAEDYIKHLTPIMKALATYHETRTYRPRTTWKERLQFIYRPSKFLTKERPFSGEWLETGPFTIGKHRFLNQKAWYNAQFTDYYIYRDHKTILHIRKIQCSDNLVLYKMIYLGDATPDLAQCLVRLSNQIIKEQHRQEEPEMQRIENRLKQLTSISIENTDSQPEEEPQ